MASSAYVVSLSTSHNPPGIDFHCRLDCSCTSGLLAIEEEAGGEQNFSMLRAFISRQELSRDFAAHEGRRSNILPLGTY